MTQSCNTQTVQHTFDKRQTWKTHISRAEAKARQKLALLSKLAGTQRGAAETVLRNVYIETIRPHLEYGSTTLSSASKSAIYTLEKVHNQALRLITGSMKSTPIRVMEETTAIQPLSKRRDMGNIIQAERYKCSPSHPMRKRMDAMTKHRIKRESFINKNNNLKRTYNNNSIKTLQCTYSSPPMSSEHTNSSLTIRTTISTVTRDQDDTSKKLLTLSHIDDFYPQATWIHVYTDGSATDAIQDGGAGSVIYRPNIGSSYSYRKILHKLQCRSESPRTMRSSRDRHNRYQLRRCSISHRFPVSIRLTSWAWRTQPQM